VTSKFTAQKTFAWSVHLLTATGAVCCLLAMNATTTASWRLAFFWLAVAVIIDAVDGFLARLFRVKQTLPAFNGELLDNIVDFGSYVLVPAFILHQAELLPSQLSVWAASGVVLASAYQFCQESAKTADHFFTGFPSYWNVAVLYLMAFQSAVYVNLAVVVLLVVLVFIPIKYVYPTRTTRFRGLTLTLATLWGLALMTIIWQLPAPHTLLVFGSLIFVVYYVGLSVFLRVRRPL